MDTNKLTTKSRDAVSAALRNALTAGNPNAEPSHLLRAADGSRQHRGAVAGCGGGRPDGRRRRRTGGDRQAAGGQWHLGESAGAVGAFARVLADAETRAEQLGDSYVATEHLLISLAAVDSDAKKILSDLKVKPDALANAFNAARAASG